MTSPPRVTARNSSLGPCSATAMDPPTSSPSSLSVLPDWERTRTSAAAASATEAAAVTSTLATHTRSAVSHLYASTRPPPTTPSSSSPSSLVAHTTYISTPPAPSKDTAFGYSATVSPSSEGGNSFSPAFVVESSPPSAASGTVSRTNEKGERCAAATDSTDGIRIVRMTRHRE